MLVKFWGTRGSLPRPGPSTFRYGGNTTCVEIRSKEGHLLVLDCGSGGYDLGVNILSRGQNNSKGHLLVSHTHWDHIQGAPFFAPFYVPGREWEIYGPQGISQSIHQALEGQMTHQYFPLSINELRAKICYNDLMEEEFFIGDVKVKTHYLNHTILTLGFRIESEDASIVYVCDHEPFSKSLAAGEGKISGLDLRYLKFLEGADLVIHDAQYTVDEYSKRVGWGHSTPDYALRLCREAGVKELVLTHHDPQRTDERLDLFNAEIQEKLRCEGSLMKVSFAREGQEITLIGEPSSRPVAENALVSSRNRVEQEYQGKIAISESTLIGHTALLFCDDPAIRSLLFHSIESEGIVPSIVENGETLKTLANSKPSLIIIEHTPPKNDGIATAQAIHAIAAENHLEIPIIIIAAEELLGQLDELEFVDWLIFPFTSSLARTKIATAIFRVVCQRKIEGFGQKKSLT